MKIMPVHPSCCVCSWSMHTNVCLLLQVDAFAAREYFIAGCWALLLRLRLLLLWCAMRKKIVSILSFLHYLYPFKFECSNPNGHEFTTTENHMKVIARNIRQNHCTASFHIIFACSLSLSLNHYKLSFFVWKRIFFFCIRLSCVRSFFCACVFCTLQHIFFFAMLMYFRLCIIWMQCSRHILL